MSTAIGAPNPVKREERGCSAYGEQGLSSGVFLPKTRLPRLDAPVNRSWPRPIGENRITAFVMPSWNQGPAEHDPIPSGHFIPKGTNRYFHIPSILAMLTADIGTCGHPGRLQAPMRLLESLGKRSKGRKYG